MTPLRPRALRKGDLIGLVSPASTIADPSRLERGARYLEGLGYRTLVGPSALKTVGYLAGTDAERTADLHAMFANPGVRALFCIRGGYGTPRLLPLLDYRMIGRNPKILVGYSDITALQLALWRKTGLVTFQGPMLGVDMADPMDPFTEELFWRLLTSAKRVGALTPPGAPATSLRAGRGSGRLLGGNLALVASLLGTVYAPDFRGSLLFFEDIGEEPYRVDRMFTQLRHARILERAAGIVTGQFTDCAPKDSSRPSLSLDEVMREVADYGGPPFLAGLPFGHESPKMTIPVGLRARLDATRGSLELLEPAVR